MLTEHPAQTGGPLVPVTGTPDVLFPRQPYGVGVTYLPLPEGKRVLVDADTAEWAGRHNWRLSQHGAVHRRPSAREDEARAEVYLHRAILGVTAPRQIVDFHNGDKLDCRRVNLKLRVLPTAEESRANRAARALVEGGDEEAAARVAYGALSEAALVARAQDGDHAAFEAIFTQYQTAIYNYIFRMMGSREDAYDMTQDTFLKAYLALASTSDDLRVSAWLYRIATNVCLDEIRHRKLVRWTPWDAFLSVFHPSQVAASKEQPDSLAINRENAEEVQLILEKLHPKYRMCLILREYHDLSYDEIAECLATTRAAVKSLLFRAREEFRQVYARVERKPGRMGTTQPGRRPHRLED